MPQFKIVLGDWSGDGGGMTESFTVETLGIFSVEDLKDNYEQNVAVWGFAPADFANKDGDSHIPNEWAGILFEHGFSNENNYLYKDVDNTYLIYDARAMLEITMFFVGYGLKGFAWKEMTENLPLLFGGHDAKITSEFIGYGVL